MTERPRTNSMANIPHNKLSSNDGYRVRGVVNKSGGALTLRSSS